MSTADTPVVARHRVRHALRRAREAKQLTQGQVAEAMEWSLSKVMRIEKGDVNISPADLRVLLSYLDVTEPVEVKRLMDDARTAHSEGWSAGPSHREHLTYAVLQLMQFEQEATALFRNYADDLDEATVKARIDAGERPPPSRYLTRSSWWILGVTRIGSSNGESHLVDEIVYVPRTLARHRTVFSQLWALGLNDRDSAQMIKDRAAAMIANARG